MVQTGLFAFLLTLFLSLAPIGMKAQEKSPEQVQTLIDSAISKMYHKDHVQSLEMLIEAKSIAHQKKMGQQEFMSTNNIAANYFLMSDFGEALNFYLEAYDLAIKNDNKENIMTVLNNISILYLHEHKLDKAYEYFHKAYDYAQQTNNTEKMALYATNLALVLNKIGQLDEANQYIKIAEKYRTPKSNFQEIIQMAIAENNLFKGNLDLAFQQAEEVLTKLKGNPHLENRVFTRLILAQVYMEKNQLKEAETEVRWALKEANSTESKIDCYKILVKIFTKGNLWKDAISFQDSIINSQDSLGRERSSMYYENGKIKFEIQNYRYDLDQSNRKVKSSQYLIYTISIASLIIILIGFWAFRMNGIKFKQKEKIAELELAKEKADNLLLEKQLKEKEVFASLEYERLKNELEKKNRKLATRALQLSNKNEVIEEVVKMVNTLPEFSKNEALKKNLLELKIQLKNENQLESFFTHFEEANPEFLNRLQQKHPDLNPNEIRFITYVYMNLNNKEIASLLNITPQSSRKRKERITKKLNVPEGENLYAYLTSI
jgi:DNA-binding CsgD family transcriptional regulator